MAMEEGEDTHVYHTRQYRDLCYKIYNRERMLFVDWAWGRRLMAEPAAPVICCCCCCVPFPENISPSNSENHLDIVCVRLDTVKSTTQKRGDGSQCIGFGFYGLKNTDANLFP
jgi:hypothetical protein